MDPYIGEIKMVGFNFAPRGWALCNGQLLAIAQNSALFSLLGTTYGGNGQTTFALPNMQSRVPIHQGQGPGLSPYVMGQESGTENVTLLSTQMPAHNHALLASSATGESNNPTSSFIGQAGTDMFAEAANGVMNPMAIGITGGTQAHNNIQPYLVVNFIIALQGIFPPRS